MSSTGTKVLIELEGVHLLSTCMKDQSFSFPPSMPEDDVLSNAGYIQSHGGSPYRPTLHGIDFLVMHGWTGIREYEITRKGDDQLGDDALVPEVWNRIVAVKQQTAGRLFPPKGAKTRGATPEWLKLWGDSGVKPDLAQLWSCPKDDPCVQLDCSTFDLSQRGKRDIPLPDCPKGRSFKERKADRAHSQAILDARVAGIFARKETASPSPGDAAGSDDEDEAETSAQVVEAGGATAGTMQETSGDEQQLAGATVESGDIRPGAGRAAARAARKRRQWATKQAAKTEMSLLADESPSAPEAGVQAGDGHDQNAAVLKEEADGADPKRDSGLTVKQRRQWRSKPSYTISTPAPALEPHRPLPLYAHPESPEPVDLTRQSISSSSTSSAPHTAPSLDWEALTLSSASNGSHSLDSGAPLSPLKRTRAVTAADDDDIGAGDVEDDARAKTARREESSEDQTE